MNHVLFGLSIKAALAAFTVGNQKDFIVAIRVAQSAIGGCGRSVKLLECALNRPTSPRVPDILKQAAKHL